MPARPDFQTDYEDPVDRLYRPKVPREKVVREEKLPNPAATVASTFGMIGLVPCLGLLFGPLAVVVGLIGLSAARRPNVSGKAKATTGLWFGLVALLINYVVPLGLFLWAQSMQ